MENFAAIDFETANEQRTVYAVSVSSLCGMEKL